MRRRYNRKAEWNEAHNKTSWFVQDEQGFWVQLNKEQEIRDSEQKFKDYCKSKQDQHHKNEQQHEAKYRVWLDENGKEWNWNQYHHLKQTGKI